MIVEGFLLVDKPSGRSSHSVVAAVRRVTGIKKVGHAGTLDPMATGLLVVALGRSTRLIRYIQDQPKTYEAVAMFGVATDSLDADGQILTREPMRISEQQVARALAALRGSIMQVPPMVSALKRDGERLYDLARRGIEVEREPRPVEVYALDMTSFVEGEFPLVGFLVHCGKGTYVRSLADDAAVSLGGRAHLTSLRRTDTGSLSLSRAVSWDDLANWEQHLIPASEALSDLPMVVTADSAAIRSGRTMTPAPDLSPDTPFRVVDGEGGLLAVYSIREGLGRPEVVLS